MVKRSKIQTRLQPVGLPLWREALFGLDWLTLRLSPVYYGAGLPRGDGAPVILVPGFLGSDTYLSELYYWLQRIGYRTYRSGIGRNTECPDILTQRLLQTVDQAYKETSQRLRLIGHSLGGTIARSAAVQRPEQVALVIALAAPVRAFRVHPVVLEVVGAVRNRVRSRGLPEARPQCYTGACTCTFFNSLRQELPPSVEYYAIYTKNDGAVDWRTCLEEDDRRNIEVRSTHIGLAFNPQVYERIARILAASRQRVPAV